jgi:hypothetical protein
MKKVLAPAHSALLRRLAVATCGLAALTATGLAADNARVENARKAFAILDMNGDKKVTYVEFANMKIDAFSAPDRNENNTLDPTNSGR